MICATPPSPATILARVREPGDSAPNSHSSTSTANASSSSSSRPVTPIAERVLTKHPLTLYAISRVTNWCVERDVAPTVISNTVLDILPEDPSSVAITKLRNRCSYMAKAPYQRKSKKKALHDKAMKLLPATWLGPTIIRVHDRYQYKKDRNYTQKVYQEYQERREYSDTTIAIHDYDMQPAPADWPIVNDEGYEIDPWKLPPIVSDDVSEIGTADGGSFDFPIPPPPRTPSPLRARTYFTAPVG